MIPISRVEFGPEEESLVLKVLRSGTVAQGPMVTEFETEFAKLSGVKHAVAVNNGTTSLVASLQALNLKPGDEVITSPFTFIATINAILEAGATAVFADINFSDFNLNPEAIKAAITSKTRAIMPVHLYGQMADMQEIMKIASEYNLRVIEDSAQSHGATQHGKTAGSFDIGSFSFYATKNLTTGEGGIITTNDDSIAETLKIMRNQGMKERYQYVMAGHNYRMTDLQAALVIPQLKRYSKTVEQRSLNANFYQKNLSGIDGLILPQVLEGRSHVWHQFTMRVSPTETFNRDNLAAMYAANDIGSGFYYPKLAYDYDTYRNRKDIHLNDCPVAEQVVKEVISIPVHQYLSTSDLERIVEVTKEAFRSN